MLNVTEPAAAHLAQLLSGAPDENVVRFVPGENGLAMQLSQAQPGDTTFDHGEKTVLALDAAISDSLSEHTLDVQPTQQGPQLTLSTG